MRDGKGNQRCIPGFTLVELLMVIGIIAVLLAVLLPTLSAVRVRAKVVHVHADLRSIVTALVMYRQDHRGQLPPTRFSCSSRTEYELPEELATGKYLPATTGPGGITVVAMPDVFRPTETYKYRAPGAAIVNESTLIADGATLWVPDGFPNCDVPTGQYYDKPSRSPVRFAVWSIGPNLGSPKFADAPGRAPVPGRFWYRGDRAGGMITHFMDRQGQLYMSP